MVFDSLVTSVTVTGGDRGGDIDQFLMRAFDVSGNILGTVTTPTFGGNPVTPSSFMVDNFTQAIAFAGIKRVEVENITTFGIGIDDLNFTPVPIPAAIWLFGSGLLGMIGIARRKKAA